MELFQTLALPIYLDPSGHKCHFKDVSLALTRVAMSKNGYPEVADNKKWKEDPGLRTEWEDNYETLKSQVQLEGYDSARFWGSQFLAKLFKEWKDAKDRRRTEGEESLSVINTKYKYSKRLRKLEETQREEEFQEAEAARSGSFFGAGLLPKARNVHFKDTLKTDPDEEVKVPDHLNPYVSMVQKGELGAPKLGKTTRVSEEVTATGSTQLVNERQALKASCKAHFVEN